MGVVQINRAIFDENGTITIVIEGAEEEDEVEDYEASKIIITNLFSHVDRLTFEFIIFVYRPATLMTSSKTQHSIGSMITADGSFLSRALDIKDIKISSLGLIVKRLPSTWRRFNEVLKWEKNTVRYAVVTAAHAASDLSIKNPKSSWFEW
jgi:hypothetical protein